MDIISYFQIFIEVLKTMEILTLKEIKVYYKFLSRFIFWVNKLYNNLYTIKQSIFVFRNLTSNTCYIQIKFKF